MEEKQPCNAKVREGGEAGDAPAIRAEIPLKPLEKTVVKQLSPCSSWSRGVCPEGSCSPWSPHAGAVS